MQMRRTFGALVLCASLCFGSVKSEEKRAEREYKAAQQLADKGDLEGAIEHADKAVAALPGDVRFFSYAALLRQMRSARELGRSRELASAGRHDDAAKLLKAALEKDPENPELAAAARVNAVSLYEGKLPSVVAEEEPQYEEQPELAPRDPYAKRDFHLRGAAGQVLTDFLRQYGIALQPDSSVLPKQIKFDATGIDFPTGLGVLLKQTHTFVVAASTTQALAFNDTPENRTNHERNAVQTFDIGAGMDPQTFNEVVNALRAVFALRFVGQTNAGKIVVKAPRAQVDEVAQFLHDVTEARAEVLLDVDEIEVTDSLVRSLGVTLPLQYQVLNVNTVLQQAGVSDVNQLINEINSGQLSTANLQALSGILSQLQSQNAGLLTFGGGKSREAIIVPPLKLSANDQQNHARVLTHTTLRASVGSNASYHDGLRYPVVTTTFSTLVNSSIVSRLFGGGTLQVPPPAVQYVDLGLTLKMTPMISANGNIRLKFDLEVKNLTGQNVNQAPVLGNRQFSGTVNLREGESAVLAGLTEDTNMRNGSGIPGLSSVGLAALGGQRTRNHQESQILIAIRPHSLRLPYQRASASQ